MNKHPSEPQELANNVRVMTILGSDCGLLAEAMYFLPTQELRERAILLLPDRLANLNPDVLDVANRRFSSFQDLVELVDQNSPDIVFLCSGYLFIQQNLLSGNEFRRFIEYTQQRGCRVITSDLFAGFMSAAVTRSATLEPTINPNKNFSPRETWILSLFVEAYEILKHLPHIYPHIYLAPSDDADPEFNSVYSYYNPESSGSCKTPESQSILRSCLGDSFSKPYCLFAIGPEDIKIQCQQLGLANLVAFTAEKVNQISESGRHVVLVLPDEFRESLRTTLHSLENVSLFSYLPYEDFYELNLNAEYAFYWNVASASALFRIMYGLPTFHFSVGHLGENLPHVYKQVVRGFFPDCKPIFIDQTKPFDMDVFMRLDGQARENATKILKSLESLPTSETLLARLRNG